MFDLVPAQGVIESIADRIAERLRPAVPAPVDLHAQVEVYLAEGGRRNAATMTEVRRTLDWFLACCDSQGLAYDSRQGAVAFKKSLAARGIEARTLNFHLGRVSRFLRWAVAHGYVEAEVVNGVKVAGGTGLAAHEERDAIDPAVLSVFLRTFDPRREPKAWLPWLLAYSGARLNECAQLWLEDIMQVDGLWCLSIHAGRPGETELKLSLAKVSNEALNKRINDAAATRNKSAPKIRHVEQALMDLSAARGSLELLVEIDPLATAKQAAALDVQEADLTKQRREADAVTAGKVERAGQRVLDAQLKGFEQEPKAASFRVRKPTGELCMKRFDSAASAQAWLSSWGNKQSASKYSVVSTFGASAA